MWAQALNALVGIWLMAAPAVVGFTGPMATSHRIVGPCIVALGVTAMAECTRGVRFWLLPFALWLVVSPAVQAPSPAGAAANSVLCGAAVAGLAMIRGRIRRRYGGGWIALLRGVGEAHARRQNTATSGLENDMTTHERNKSVEQSSDASARDARTPVVIVTGSSGRIGKAVIDALRSRFQIVGFDRDGEPQPPKEVECVCVDLTDDSSVRRGLERVRYAYGAEAASVIHLAAYYDFSGEPSALYDEVTVRGTARLLSTLRELEFEVEQFLFSSTMLVHKPTEPGRPFDESQPLEARWDYPRSKIETEQLIRRQRGDMPAVILRIAGVYTDVCDSIPLSRQIQRIQEDRLTARVFPGDISHGQAFVHLDDVVSAIVACVDRRDSLGGEAVMLVGEPVTYSYDRLQREIARLLRGEDDWTTQTIPKSVARTGAWIKNQIPGIEDPFIKPWMVDLADDHYEIDIGRAKQRLGWTPRKRLIDTLPSMIEHLRNDPSAWYERHGIAPLPEEPESLLPHDRAEARM